MRAGELSSDYGKIPFLREKISKRKRVRSHLRKNIDDRRKTNVTSANESL